MTRNWLLGAALAASTLALAGAPAQAATSTTPRPAPGKITRTLAMQIDRRGASLATTSVLTWAADARNTKTT